MTEQIAWGVIFIVTLIAELASAQLISIWFAVSALITFVVSFFVPFPVQIIIFVVISALLLIITRPLMKKISAKEVPTNADLDIGKTVMLTEEVNNDKCTGRAILNGVGWMAVSVDNEIIPKDSMVKIEKINGAKLMVTKIK